MKKQQKIYLISSTALSLVAAFVLAAFFSRGNSKPEAWTATDNPFYQGDVGDYYDDGELYHPNDIAVDGSGDYYVSNYYNYRIEKFDSSGNFITNWGGQGSGDGQFQDTRSIVIDGADNIYVSDPTLERIQKFDSDGNFLLKWGSAGSGNGQFNNPNGAYGSGMTLAVDGSNNIYVADRGNNRIQKFNSSGTHLQNFTNAVLTTPNGVGVDLNTGNVIAAEYSQMNIFDSSGTLLDDWNQPGESLDIAIDSSGDILSIANSPAYIYKYDQAGNLLDTFNDSTTQGHTDGDLSNSRGMGLDGSGNILIADTGNNRYQVFNTSGTYIKKGGSEVLNGYNFYYPYDIAFDQSGNYYVLDTGSYRVQKYNSSGVYQLTVGRTDGEDGTGDGEFDYAEGLGVDSSGNLYVADSSNDRIQKFNSAGAFQLKFGTSGSGNGQFDYPTDVAVDDDGFIYVVDAGNDRVQKFTSAGEYITQWGTSGSGNGQLDYPSYIAIESDFGDVWVTDYNNNRVERFTKYGIYIDQFGTSGTGDGEFDGPAGIAIDSQNNLFVLDQNNNRVQRFDENGTYKGQLGGTYGAGDQELDYPYGLGFNENTGELFIPDTFNNRIQKYQFDIIPPDIYVSAISVNPSSGNTRYIRGLAEDSLTNITSIQFKINVTGTWTNCTISDGLLDEKSETFICSYTRELDPGSYNFYLRSTDSMTNTGSSFIYPFTVAGSDGTTDDQTDGTADEIADDQTDERINDTEVVDEPGNVVEFLNDSLDQINLGGLPQKIIDIHNKIAPITLSALLAILATSSLLAYPYSTIYYGIEWLADIKKKKAYGLVFDKRDKKPIPFAIVELFKGEQLIKRAVTNNHGKFLLIADKGEYTIKIKQMAYQDYSEQLKINSNEYSITETFGILKKEDNFSTNVNLARKSIRKTAPLLFYAGLTWSAIALLLSFTLFNMAIVALYLVQILILLFNKAPRNWGFVFDVDSRMKLPKIFVQAYDPNTNQAVDTQITDEYGRFGFTLPGKIYELLVNSEGYKLAANNKTVEKAGRKYIKYQVGTNKIDRIGLERK
ncbi:carboxypeptidase-like regulatory domain-containing protein [Candidatus Dojkabacteria bacterium]|nr:carboxypeptidase-like regulatory domain-containing protein [Candidatus Dojkabacteria bacterium]